MKIDLASFGLCASRKDKKAFLLYGGSEEMHYGLISELKSHFVTMVIDEENLLPGFDCLISADLFSPKLVQNTAIVVYEISEKEFPKYVDIIGRLPCEYILVITSLSARASSKFVKYFTENNFTGAVACYECSTSQSMQILKRRGANLDFEAMQICAESARNGSWDDILSLASLYSAENLTKKDVAHFADVACIDASIFSQNKNVLCGKLNEMQDAQLGECMQILRGWQVQVLQALMLKRNLESGLSSFEAEKKIVPAIFFKNAKIVQHAASCMSYQKLSSILGVLLLSEVCIKSSGKVTPEFCLRIINSLF